MAFMMPVVRNDYDIYNRSRKCSPETSHGSSPSGSTSLSTSPCVHDGRRRAQDCSALASIWTSLQPPATPLRFPWVPPRGSIMSSVDKLKRAGHHSSNHAHGADSAADPGQEGKPPTTNHGRLMRTSFF
uniref:Uncharacterized protein n=1 Tax=Ixodes ricinus TaxID=34613 RepID=A0A090XBK5_IXORI